MFLSLKNKINVDKLQEFHCLTLEYRKKGWTFYCLHCIPLSLFLSPYQHGSRLCRVSFSPVNSQKWIYIANASKTSVECVEREGEKQSINVAQRIVLHMKGTNEKREECKRWENRRARGNWNGEHSELKLTKRKVCQATAIWNGNRPSGPISLYLSLSPTHYRFSWFLSSHSTAIPVEASLCVCLVVFFIKYS